MRKHFLTFLLLALIGCKEEKIPQDVLPIQKMAVILVDMHLAEGKIEELRLRSDTARMVLEHFEMKVLEKHGIEAEVYRKSFQYHINNVKTMDEIYAIVVDSLNVRRQVSRID